MDRRVDRRMARRLEISLDRPLAVRGATPSLHCPDCGAPMRLLAMLPARSAQGGEEITYRCEVCSTNLQDCALAPAA
jgi:DNA-directed RNA polymerase subunit M/transcription elongation factor TFIIS